jgi:tryptophanyl-tRNA synthetase
MALFYFKEMGKVKERILSGMRPTGRLHLGNYLGALDNWVKLQDAYDCFFFVADWHALTTGYENTSSIKEDTRQMVIDWLSAGLDPNKNKIFVQSMIKEHAELYLLLSMITPNSWLERCPTYKDQLIQLESKNIATHGFLGYPVLMTVDIIIYKANRVPVGEDQAAHLEISREIARRFNNLYKEVFPEPQILLNRVPMLPGVDGRKMSKSYGNDISLSASPKEIKEKVQMMITDPQRISKSDPGHPEVCIVHKFHTIFSSDMIESITSDCRKGSIGCVACKNNLVNRLTETLMPIHARRAELEKDSSYVDDVLAEGAKKARLVAAQTMQEVREAMRTFA